MTSQIKPVYDQIGGWSTSEDGFTSAEVSGKFTCK